MVRMQIHIDVKGQEERQLRHSHKCEQTTECCFFAIPTDIQCEWNGAKMHEQNRPRNAAKVEV